MRTKWRERERGGVGTCIRKGEEVKFGLALLPADTLNYSEPRPAESARVSWLARVDPIPPGEAVS